MSTTEHVPPGDDGERCPATMPFGADELPCMDPAGHAGAHRLSRSVEWTDEWADEQRARRTAASSSRTGDDLRARIARLLPTTPLADEHCHATITDEDGEEDACGMPAAHWVIYDPETGDQRAWPVCYGHASGSYSGSVADEWVEALTGALALLEAHRAHVADALADTLGEGGRV